MAVDMKRSTNMAPVSLSTSYLMGSAFIGISMITLKSSGRSRPESTRSRFIWAPSGKCLYYSGGSPSLDWFMRMVGTVILGIAIAYTAFAGTLYVIQERMVFFPELPGRALSATPAAVGLRFEEVNLEAGDGVSIHGWFVPAPAPHGAVLICHGNAGNIAHRLEYL